MDQAVREVGSRKLRQSTEDSNPPEAPYLLRFAQWYKAVPRRVLLTYKLNFGQGAGSGFCWLLSYRLRADTALIEFLQKQTCSTEAC